MPEAIREAFFSDKARTIATLVLLATIIFVVIGTWAFPRHQGVDQETINTLKQVSNQIQRAADNFEKQSSSTVALNEELTRQLKQAENIRNEGYDELLKKYGIDTEGTDGIGNNPFPELSDRLQPPDNHLGGVNLSPGTKPADGDQQLQVADPERQSKVDGSHSRSDKPAPGDARKPVGEPHNVPG